MHFASYVLSRVWIRSNRTNVPIQAFNHLQAPTTNRKWNDCWGVIRCRVSGVLPRKLCLWHPTKFGKAINVLEAKIYEDPPPICVKNPHTREVNETSGSLHTMFTVVHQLQCNTMCVFCNFFHRLITKMCVWHVCGVSACVCTHEVCSVCMHTWCIWCVWYLCCVSVVCMVCYMSALCMLCQN